MYLDKVDAMNFAEYLNNLAIDQYVQDEEAELVKIKYDSKNNIIDDPISEYAYEESRYVGSNPNNYVWFNCDESWPRKVSSQNGSHCERWRIIGVMDTNTTGESEFLVKIIRDSIGSIPLDAKVNGSGSSTSQYGSSDWSDSQLMMILNSSKSLNQGYRGTTNIKDIHGRNYEVDETTGKVYYIKPDTSKVIISTMYDTGDGFGGAYYNRVGSYASTGLKNDTKNYIKSLFWKLGGYTNEPGLLTNLYKYERGTTVANTNRPTTWYGEIGLMYPTDWALATNLGKETSVGSGNLCKNNGLTTWNNYANCYSNWLYDRTAKDGFFTISPNLGSNWNGSYAAFIVESKLSNSRADMARYVKPVLYLKNNLLIFGGDGSLENPYMLMI